MKEVRCKKCGQMLAKILNNGLIECKNGRRVIVTERALLLCLKCGSELLLSDDPEQQNGERA